ncbi:MAG: 5-amino-6-(D-ribitylamino)uracil--L-tyrosine 4-hydroxyphenyl transferase CofH [Rhodospirillaceae bacterium]|nr:5-amino-6-(D-ribitylamino)uracil--L-tyrosine 4-hydroxyphenyl transferase CofH [Rhodospirillaceae bacterium]
MRDLTSKFKVVFTGGRISDADAMTLAAYDDLPSLMHIASALRDSVHGDVISYSRKVFIPLTKLCRNSCHYCTFAHPPRPGVAAYLTRSEVLEIARAGARAGCNEALFTLGDKPELRYKSVRAELAALGHESTLSYLVEMAGLVLAETGLLPHINAGVMSEADILRLRSVSVSQGLMLESSAPRLSQRGGPHFGSPDKDPEVRLKCIAAAGVAAVPFTTGILIGIGETRAERIDALLKIRALAERYGHVQEVIIQNFRAKSGTRMSEATEPEIDDHLWTIAIARLLLGAEANVQAPPNLQPTALAHLIAAGINDWGGVSPVTADHVNPEAPWPAVEVLARDTAAAGKTLTERLAIYPAYLRRGQHWLARGLMKPTLRHADAEGYARSDTWVPGSSAALPRPRDACGSATPRIDAIIARACDGHVLSQDEIVHLLAARGNDFHAVVAAADRLRKMSVGGDVTYVVTRNINYTNVCSYRCKFCAFSKGKLSENLRGAPYDLDIAEIRRRAIEAWQRGATEVCLQGGIHPDYTGETYLKICRTIHEAVPNLHIHAFSPLEVWQGAATLGISLKDFLRHLKNAGLGSLPGTAAEILDDEVRAIICPDKITTNQWLEVMETAHAVGLRSTATIMFGHVDNPSHWARHILRIRALQTHTGGFTEFVPLPFVPMETPLYLKMAARQGPTFRESILIHAVARLALHPVIPNIQTSWVKMGREGAMACLQAGANDLGGTLMNETITRAAGAVHGQEMSPSAMTDMIVAVDRNPRQRTTLYGTPPTTQTIASFEAAPLAPVVNSPARRFERRAIHEGAN